MSTARALAEVATRHETLVGQSLAVVERVAIDYLRAGALAYSAAHPRRKVTLCSAMGSTTLHVQKGGEAGRRPIGWGYTEYQITTDDHGDKVAVPQFLRDIADALEKTDQHYFGPIRIECLGGKIVREDTHW